MGCYYCGKERTLARGLCQACYYRLRRNGSLERKNVVNGGKCSVAGCDNDAFAKNLCQSHYTKADHPLKATWKLLRSRNPGNYDPSWDKFETFVGSVGSRPSPKHQLRRIDAAKPFSNENVAWFEPVQSGPSLLNYDNYGRAWALRKKYGIGPEKYQELLAAQSGVCSICGNKESHVYKSGKPKDLSVDHCHDTGKVRGLLCANCNRALGYFGDSIERLRRAISYLEKHK